MNILLSTTNNIPNHKINKIIGVICGEAVISTNALQDRMSGLKATFGGKLENYTKLIQKSREEAEENLLEEAISYNADAVIGVRYATTSIMQGTAEIMVYGTAVKLEKI